MCLDLTFIARTEFEVKNDLHVDGRPMYNISYIMKLSKEISPTFFSFLWCKILSQNLYRKIPIWFVMHGRYLELNPKYTVNKIKSHEKVSENILWGNQTCSIVKICKRLAISYSRIDGCLLPLRIMHVVPLVSVCSTCQREKV